MVDKLVVFTECSLQRISVFEIQTFRLDRCKRNTRLWKLSYLDGNHATSSEKSRRNELFTDHPAL